MELGTAVHYRLPCLIFFVNPCFNEAKCAGTGCEIGNKFVDIIMYADDILLLSPTVFGLQILLNKCSELFNSKQLEFNLSKSKCITIGPASSLNIKPLLLQGGTISWENNFKYLGVNFLADKKLTVDTDIIKRKNFLLVIAFYAKHVNLTK